LQQREGCTAPPALQQEGNALLDQHPTADLSSEVNALACRKSRETEDTVKLKWAF